MNSNFTRLTMALAALLFTPALRAQDSGQANYEKMAQWQFGQSREPLALIQEAIRQTTPAGYSAIEARLLTALKAPDTTKDAKRYLCRWLSVVGSEKCVPMVAELLKDEDLSHLARFALEALPTPAAGAALRGALPKVKGKSLAGVIASIGVRRDPLAVEALSPFANASDPLIAETAIRALGEIGTVPAAQALDKLAAPAELSRALARAKITAASHLATAGKNAQAANLYQSLMVAEQPQFIRLAAFKGLIGSLSRSEAVKLIIDNLQGDEVAMRNATISAYVSSSDQRLQDAVANELPSLNLLGQRLLLGVLADMPNVTARSAVKLVLERSADVTTQVAALQCLARHGQAADVPMLVKLAQSPTQELAGAAQGTLERMNHPGVDNALVKLIEAPEAGDRTVVLATLGSRRVESALPTLERLVTGHDLALATEAAKALEIMGHTGQLPALATVLVRAQNANLRSAAEGAAQAICRRAPDKIAAAGSLVDALAQANSPEALQSILPLLVITGGEKALQAVHQATKDDNPEVRDTAIRTLVAWPDLSAVPHLLELGRSAPTPTYSILALRDGCLRLAQMEEWPMAQRLDLYRQVLELAKRPEEKKQAISGLAQLPSLGAFELLKGCAKDSALQKDAILATTRLARQLGAVYHEPVMAALEQMKSQTTNPDILKQIEQAIKAVQNVGQSPEGFIVAWMLSGPYAQDGKSGSELFDTAFAPEEDQDKAQWRPVTVPPNGRPGLVEMDKIFGGNNRAAYLRTQITSEKAQEALLEMGSDDGIKVWLNGQVVHANNATRPCSPGQDQARIQLKPGPNTLMLKITQGGGEWSACCRARSPDGKELDSVMIAPSQ